MAAKGEIISIETIKPSTPTPDNLREFKLSLLDQLIPHQVYIPLLLCYSHHDINNAFGGTDDHFSVISQKLKTSLSQALTLYYPYCGTTVKDNLSIDCNDTGVVFIESKVNANLSDILIDPLLDVMVNDFFPFDPYNFDEPEANMAVRLNQFNCGGIALGVSFNHKLGDAITTASFLKAWSLIARGQGSIVAAPQMETSNLYFPPKNFKMPSFRDMLIPEDNVTKRFIFSGTNLSRIRDKVSSSNKNLSRVEAVTALIWKSALEAAATANSDKEQIIHASKVIHVVGIRGRVDPPLPEVTRGNLIIQSLSPKLELKGEVGLHDFAEMARKAVRSVDKDYVSKIVGDGILKVVEEMRASKEEGVPVYTFSSVTRLDYYENDFGWGKPTWLGTVGRRPNKNTILLFTSRDGEGTEAWITLPKAEMVEFERNPEILQYTSVDC
ncbi:hypothetical protein TanjilG_14969 [Lupinus angustifolius]|uniref:Uncharacterized protein n=1 Tax=Lupinus angustifolius TaxID=3871 RepID=A0A394DBD7_LUPAN|nr:PREDICTED: vinorine synthase-like [Lupinus angustifolius]OIW20565.1 hypothetical protein TanjilG_14969 [Lupinus angustifolius]